MRNFPLNFRTFCRNPEKPSIRSEPSIVSKFQKRDGNFAELAERAMREREKPEFVYKILRIRHVRSPRERLASSSAAAARFCAASKPIVFYLAASMAALIGSDVRRSGKRLMCFAHFRDILSVTAELHPPPPSTPFVASFATALFNSGVRLPRSRRSRTDRSLSHCDNFFGRSSSRNSAARIFRSFSSYIPAR